MSIRHAMLGLVIITLLYLGALVWVDARNQVFDELPGLVSALPILLGFSLLSYIVRYLRWYWLLWRVGSSLSVPSGFLAYLSGFAFTATPGKVGELIRIRYLSRQGVPPWKVLAAFVYERAVDLIAVLLLAALAIKRADMFVFVLGFVALLLLALMFFAFKPALLSQLAVWLQRYRLRRLSRITCVLRDGLAGSRSWMTPLDVLVSLLLGLAAWGITAFSFVWLLVALGVTIPLLSALAIYPLAMLAGAASMVPGGVGTTEVAIVALLSMFELPIGTATLAAVGIRFASIWFAVVCGFFSMCVLEFVFLRQSKLSSLGLAVRGE